MSDRAHILARLDPDAALLEPREFFDEALVDATDMPKDHWPRQARMMVAVYDRSRCIEAIQKWLHCDEDAAQDYFGYNTEGAWVGDGTPTFRGAVCPGDYLAEVEDCPECGERFCTVCEKHWADCPCSGPG